MTAPARFRQSDVTRFFKGAAKAGVEFTRVEICPITGKIMGFLGAPPAANDTAGDNEWDDVLET